MLTPEKMTVEQKIGTVLCANFVYQHEGDLEFALEQIKSTPSPASDFLQTDASLRS